MEWREKSKNRRNSIKRTPIKNTNVRGIDNTAVRGGGRVKGGYKARS